MAVKKGPSSWKTGTEKHLLCGLPGKIRNVILGFQVIIKENVHVMSPLAMLQLLAGVPS